MSLLVALTCPDCAVISTDRRCIRGPKDVSDTYDKTFSLGDGMVIAGVTGILEINGKPISDLIAQAWPAKTLRDLAEAARCILETELRKYTKGTELVLVGSENLDRSGRPVILIVNAEGGAKPAFSTRWNGHIYVTGQAEARDAARRPLDLAGWGPVLGKLRRDAEEAIKIGIQRTGDSPDHPGVAACGGIPSTQTLQTAADPIR